MGISTGDLDAIDHSVCVRREDSWLNIDIDEETIKKMLKDASQSVRNIASQVMHTASVVFYFNFYLFSDNKLKITCFYEAHPSTLSLAFAVSFLD